MYSLHKFTFSFTFFFFFISLLPATTPSHHHPPSRPTIGITYNSRLHRQQQQQQLIPTLKSLKITSVRLPDSTPDVIRSFSYSGISLLLSVPNSLIPRIASNQSEALRWLNHHITPFYPRVHVSTISVGENVVDEDPSSDVSQLLISAILNLRRALDELGIDRISVSTTFSFVTVISTTFPPSSSQFQQPIADTLMKPLLDFLSQTNSSFLINIHPYNLYRSQPLIPIGYALFQEHPFVFRDDLITGVRYRNLFDVMVDCVITSMAMLGHEDVPLIVTETGWPSSDESKEVDASQTYAEMYLKGLVSHLTSGLGTPLRRDGVAETYILELFDGDGKDGSTQKRQWGILNPDTSPKYKIDFSSSPAEDSPRKALAFWWFVIVFVLAPRL